VIEITLRVARRGKETLEHRRREQETLQATSRQKIRLVTFRFDFPFCRYVESGSFRSTY